MNPSDLFEVLLGREAWKIGAPCSTVDPDAFFPGPGENLRTIKKICFSCDVRTRCRDYAIDNGIPHGLWGGMSYRERRAYQNKRPA